MLNLSFTLAIGLPLAFLHVWSPYVHPGTYIDSRYWRPFADGISITYVFLQLLPEITHLADEELHPDERYVLLTRRDSSGADLQLVKNFR